MLRERLTKLAILLLKTMFFIQLSISIGFFSPLECSAETIAPAPSVHLTFKRVGVWNFDEGYITNITFRDDSNLCIYLANPEGAAIWELNTEGPSKKKTVPSGFLANLIPNPEWLTNVALEYSPSRKYLLIWPTIPEGKHPACILLRFEQGIVRESISLDLPDGFLLRAGSFSSDDRYLAISRHPSSSVGSEICVFDLTAQKQMGMIRSNGKALPGSPGLVSNLAFEEGSYRLWISTAIFRKQVYDPPLLVGLASENSEELPLIQGTLLPDGLIADSSGITVLLDPRKAAGKAGLDPSNWWEIRPSSRIALRPSALRGQFTRVWQINDSCYAAVFKPRSGDGKMLAPRFVILSQGTYSTVAPNVRLAACSPNGNFAAVVIENSNRLELLETSEVQESDGAPIQEGAS